MKVIDLNNTRKMHANIIKKVRRNKTFRNGTIDGYTVTASESP